jgi:putative transposase
MPLLLQNPARWQGMTLYCANATTNAIESVNMNLRKVTKNRGSFPSDEALTKLLYLALKNISQKWTMPIRDWKAALTRFTIQFDDRLNGL